MGSDDRRSLRLLVIEDFRNHGSRPSSPAFRALAVYRFARWRDALPPGLRRKTLGLAYEILRRHIRGRHWIELHHTASIGRRVSLDDRGGIVIGNDAVLGDDCVVSPYVTMAKTRVGRPGRPTIGDRVVIGPGASFIGGVAVGDDAVIGPNSVVVTDVPQGSTLTVRAAGVARRVASQSADVGEVSSRSVELRGHTLPDGVEVDRGVRIVPSAPPHLYGNVTIGEECAIAERVSLGWNPPRDPRPESSTTRLGQRVEVAAGVVILRGVTIGDDARIDPNCVVESDVPARSIVTAARGRRLAGLRETGDV